MAAMIEKKCGKCRCVFSVRLADHKRGWGKFCSKACKAKKQTSVTGVDGPNYRASGRNVDQMRNGSYAKSKFKGSRKRVPPWVSAGVSEEEFRHYAEEYGGTPVFNSRGEYDGFIPGPFDNTAHQNSDPNE